MMAMQNAECRMQNGEDAAETLSRLATIAGPFHASGTGVPPVSAPSERAG
jgi:hypothetical protein